MSLVSRYPLKRMPHLIILQQPGTKYQKTVISNQEPSTKYQEAVNYVVSVSWSVISGYWSVLSCPNGEVILPKASLLSHRFGHYYLSHIPSYVLGMEYGIFRLTFCVKNNIKYVIFNDTVKDYISRVLGASVHHGPSELKRVPLFAQSGCSARRAPQGMPSLIPTPYSLLSYPTI